MSDPRPADRFGPRPSPRTGVRPREHAGAVAPARRVGAPLPDALPAVRAGAATTSRVPAAKKPRPDPGPLRIALGLAGMATASALVSAFLNPSTGVSAATGGGTDPGGAAGSGSVRHVTRYVQLQPGQTAPSNAVVQAAPTPQPRLVIVRTQQSGGG